MLYKATKLYYCDCCGQEIKPGEYFKIQRGGYFFKLGHDEKKETEPMNLKTSELEPPEEQAAITERSLSFELKNN